MPDQEESTTLLLQFSGDFLDLRVRYGIKLNLASLLSLYVALVLRLEHPNWGVLTALVLMNSHFVGSSSMKAILRFVGSVPLCLRENGFSTRFLFKVFAKQTRRSARANTV